MVKMSKYVAEYKENRDRVLLYVLMMYRISSIGKYKILLFEMLYGSKAMMPRFIKRFPSDFILYFEIPLDYLEQRRLMLESGESVSLEFNRRHGDNIGKSNNKRLDP